MTDVPRIEWNVPAYLPYLQPPLTDSVVKDAEKILGLRLPDEYIAALREQNGGYLRYGWRKYVSEELWGIGPRYPSILKGTLAQHFERVRDVWLPRKADKLVPFAGDGHWYLCFDARKSRDKPAVAYVDVDSEHHRLAAPSFAQFLIDALATRDEELHLGLITSTGLEEAACRLGRALDMAISSQGDQYYGYEVFHGAAASTYGAASSQFWISRNEVARGFVRRDDDEYQEMVGLLPGTALRHRAHPDCALVVEFRDIPLDELLAACTRADLPARKL